MASRRARRRAAAALLALLLAGVALAQYGADPFFEHTEAIGAAHGLERLASRLAALSAVGDPDGAYAEEIEGALARDLPRFRGTLGAEDADLLGRLEMSLASLEEALDGGDAAGEVALALGLAGEARAIVVPETLLADPPFAASLLALLLLAEEGVAERFEETVEGEEAAYAGGRATLERVHALWRGLEPLATDTQRFEIDDMLGELDALFPSIELPARALLLDPEAAEDPAQRIAGFLEEIADASLFPDRELGRTAGLVRGLVEEGCGAPDDALGRQRVATAGFYYAQYLGNTVGLLVPEAHEALEPIWLPFAEEADDMEADDGEADDGEASDGDGEASASDGSAAAPGSLDCPALLDALDRVAGAFGG